MHFLAQVREAQPAETANVLPYWSKLPCWIVGALVGGAGGGVGEIGAVGGCCGVTATVGGFGGVGVLCAPCADGRPEGPAF